MLDPLVVEDLEVLEKEHLGGSGCFDFETEHLELELDFQTHLAEVVLLVLEEWDCQTGQAVVSLAVLLALEVWDFQIDQVEVDLLEELVLALLEWDCQTDLAEVDQVVLLALEESGFQIDLIVVDLLLELVLVLSEWGFQTGLVVVVHQAAGLVVVDFQIGLTVEVHPVVLVAAAQILVLPEEPWMVVLRWVLLV